MSRKSRNQTSAQPWTNGPSLTLLRKTLTIDPPTLPWQLWQRALLIGALGVGTCNGTVCAQHVQHTAASSMQCRGVPQTEGETRAESPGQIRHSLTHI